MAYLIKEGSVYFEDDGIYQLIGASQKVEVRRISDEIVEDVTYVFDEKQEKFVKLSVVARYEQQSQEELTVEERLSILGRENKMINAQIQMLIKQVESIEGLMSEIATKANP